MKPIFHDYHPHVDALVKAALSAADPATAVRQHLQKEARWLIIGRQRFHLAQGRLFLVSVGKAAVAMGLAAAEIVGDDLTAGIIITKKGNQQGGFSLQPSAFSLQPSAFSLQPSAVSLQPSAFSLLTGGHPIADESSIEATTAVMDLLADTAADDLVLCLISGGTSALLTRPLVPLADWQAVNRALLASGCPIHEFNCVRRQLDEVKGGGLAQMAAPATCITLILSDVVGNPLPAIGSGPTVLSPEPPSEALAILQQYNVPAHLDTAVWERFRQILAPAPLPPPPAPIRTFHQIIGDVGQAATAVLATATQLGFQSQLLTTHLEGEAREVGRVMAAIAKDLAPGHCLILGGETTVTVRGTGRGGRNQEVALAAAIALEGQPHTVIASLATDGEDGPTDAAGAMITGETAAYGRDHNLDPLAYLARNDSYHFFRQLGQHTAAGGLIQTGPTGTNVNDITFILTYPE